MTGAAPLFDGLLDAVPGDAPSGPSLQFAPTYTEIREARRADDTLPRGVWERKLKSADHDLVATLCRAALRDASKDLLIGAWLVESAAKSFGYGAIPDGLGFLASLSEGFWADMHPLDDGDEDSPRLAPVYWLDGALELVVRTTPLSRWGRQEGGGVLSWSDFAAARHRETALRAGAAEKKRKGPKSPSAADHIARFAALTTPELRDVMAELGAIRSAAVDFDDRFAALAGDRAPRLVKLAEAVEDVALVLRPILNARDVEAEPEPAQTSDGPRGDDALRQEIATMNAAISPSAAGGLALSDVDSAYAALAEIDAFLRRADPHSPAPYLIARAVRWRGMALPEVLDEVSAKGLHPEALSWLFAD